MTEYVNVWEEDDWEEDAVSCVNDDMDVMMYYYQQYSWDLDDLYCMCCDDPSVSGQDWFLNQISKCRGMIVECEEKIKRCQAFLDGRISEDDYYDRVVYVPVAGTAELPEYSRRIDVCQQFLERRMNEDEFYKRVIFG